MAMGKSTKSLAIIMKKVANKVGSQVAMGVDARCKWLIFGR